MKVRIIENSRIPKMLSWFINIQAITIYPFIINIMLPKIFNIVNTLK